MMINAERKAHGAKAKGIYYDN